MTIELRNDPQGQFTGTITHGDQKMPVKARLIDDKLIGTFDSGGRSFDFSASLVGGDIQLATGVNTFTLSRKVDAGKNANPLDANPPVANPLDKPPAVGNPPMAAPAAAAPGASPAPATPPGVTVLNRQMVFDPFLQMNAMSVLVPDGWKLGSWTQTQPGWPQPTFGISVGDHAGGVGVYSFPAWNYWSGYREYMVSMSPTPAAKAQMAQMLADGVVEEKGYEVRTLPRTPREYVQNVLIPRYARDLCKNIASANDVTLVAEAALPNLDKKLSDGDAFHRHSESSRFRFSYSTPTGPRETEFTCTLRSFPPNPNGVIIWTAGTTLYTAPKGQLDRMMPTLVGIVTSVTAQPDWFALRMKVDWQYTQMLMQVGQAQLKQQMADDAARMAMIHEANRQANVQSAQRLKDQSAQIDQRSAQINQNFDNYLKQKDAASEQVVEFVNGTASFKSANDGSTLILQGNYTYQYEDNHGNIIQTNDAAYQPPLDANTSWQRLRPAQ